jgi:hypothetical protein
LARSDFVLNSGKARQKRRAGSNREGDMSKANFFAIVASVAVTTLGSNASLAQAPTSVAWKEPIVSARRWPRRRARATKPGAPT